MTEQTVQIIITLKVKENDLSFELSGCIWGFPSVLIAFRMRCV